MITLGTPFGSEKVITEKISESTLRTYLVGFDVNDKNERYYRLESLVNLLSDAIPEFAFGQHEGNQVSLTKVRSILRESARAIYKIKEFEETRKIYDGNGFLADDSFQKKLLERGEFGELILHLLLRDFLKTIPLLSKIYFKDAYSATVHGFDAVHVQPDARSLCLGESKLYINGKKGVSSLIEDVKCHFKRDYLNDEFAIISKKVKHFNNIPEKDYWLGLMDPRTKLSVLLDSVTIPLLCTYSSDNFTKYNNENLQAFKDDYEQEVRGLKEYFDENYHHPLKTNLNVILLLFPVRCKNELVRNMHERLYRLQRV
jgi:hypothetical protein